MLCGCKMTIANTKTKNKQNAKEELLLEQVQKIKIIIILTILDDPSPIPPGVKFE
jgi:hypothetical protein